MLRFRPEAGMVSGAIAGTMGTTFIGADLGARLGENLHIGYHPEHISNIPLDHDAFLGTGIGLTLAGLMVFGISNYLSKRVSSRDY